MVDALLFGSIGVIAETSEIQRLAYNQSFDEHGFDWYWSIANYCELLKSPGGKKRIIDFANAKLSDDIIDSIHERKERIFFEKLKAGLSPREGIVECINVCRKKGIKISLITTTSQNNIDALEQALSNTISFKHFDLITTKADVKKAKPSGEVYKFALSQLQMRANYVIAIEDTEVNQQAALENEILCYLFAGEYAATQHNFNAVKSPTAILSLF